MSLSSLMQGIAETGRHLIDIRRSRSALVILDSRWEHGRHSGYLVGTGVGYKLQCQNDRVLPIPVRLWVEKYIGGANLEPRQLLALNLRLSGARVMHLVNGDFDRWAYKPRLPLKSVRITATFHQPVDKLHELVRGLSPGLLDGIVCVSRDQMPLLQPLVPAGKCVFIPHGVDTKFFSPGPPPESGKGPLVLSVGAHRRDFPTLVAAARLIKQRLPDTTIRLIAPAEKAKWVVDNGSDAVEVRSNVSDEELVRQYRKASVVLIPLEGATANNALLEGMACGKPIVVTDLPAIRDYADQATVSFCALADAEGHAQATIGLLNNHNERLALSNAAHARAQRLDWAIIRQQLAQFMRVVGGLSS